MNYVVTTAPATEPLTLAEVKAHLRVDGADSDTLLTALIIAARENAEKYLRRALITQTIQARYDSFSYDMYIPRPRLVSVSYVKYLDADGVEQTLDPSKYKVDSYSEPARILPAYGLVWPVTRHEMNAVTVEFIAGYGAAADVPQAIKQAMLLHVGHMFENREQTTPVQIYDVPMSYDALMAPYRVWRFE